VSFQSIESNALFPGPYLHNVWAYLDVKTISIQSHVAPRILLTDEVYQDILCRFNTDLGDIVTLQALYY